MHSFIPQIFIGHREYSRPCAQLQIQLWTKQFLPRGSLVLNFGCTLKPPWGALKNSQHLGNASYQKTRISWQQDQVSVVFKTSPGDFNVQSHLRTSCMKTIQGTQVLPLNQYGRAWGQHSPHESSRRRQELSWPRCTVREPGLGLRIRSSQPLILLLVHQGGPSGLHAVWPWVAFHLVGHLALVLSKNLVNDGHCSLCSPGLSVFFLCEKPVEFFL